MNLIKAYYLQQMGYTVWQLKKDNEKPDCQCKIACHNLDHTPLLCCLETLPRKAEKDLWIFLTMAFDLSQQYYQIGNPAESFENKVCPTCIKNWLLQSNRHHAIAFGRDSLANNDEKFRNLLIVPSLKQMIETPILKKQCFKDIQNFLCQQHLVI